MERAICRYLALLTGLYSSSSPPSPSSSLSTFFFFFFLVTFRFIPFTVNRPLAPLPINGGLCKELRNQLEEVRKCKRDRTWQGKKVRNWENIKEKNISKHFNILITDTFGSHGLFRPKILNFYWSETRVTNRRILKQSGDSRKDPDVHKEKFGRITKKKSGRQEEDSGC